MPSWIAGSTVLTFKVTSQEDSPITVTTNYNKQFALVDDTFGNYTVVLKDSLDRETVSRYDLIITIYDGTDTQVIGWGFDTIIVRWINQIFKKKP